MYCLFIVADVLMSVCLLLATIGFFVVFLTLFYRKLVLILQNLWEKVKLKCCARGIECACCNRLSSSFGKGYARGKTGQKSNSGNSNAAEEDDAEGVEMVENTSYGLDTSGASKDV